jgi:hypothetical protein
MEDYSKMTKQELIDKLNEQKHLAQAINIKDKEIATLKTELKQLKQEVATKVPLNDHKDIIKEYEKKLNEFKGAVKKEDIEKYIKQAEEDRQKAYNLANRYVTAYRDLLKVFKINLDIAISTDELLSDKLKGD